MEKDKLGRKRSQSQGGAGPKALPKQTMGKLTGKMIRRPAHLTDSGGGRFWMQACTLMEKLGILEGADFHILELAASAYQRIAEARKDIQKNGRIVDEGRRRNPAFVTLEKAEAALHSRLSDLGLTPSARAKFAPPKESTDPFDALFAKTN